MRVLHSLVLFCVALSPAVLPAQKSCSVVPADAPVTPAEQAYRNGDYAKAYELYSAAYAAKPDDELLEGAVRSAIESEQIDKASAVVMQHPSGSAWYLLAKARLELYRGQVEEAQRDAVAAVRADICNAHAHYFAARLLRLNSMYAAARKQIDVAHQLDRSSPEIQASWLGLQPIQEQIAFYKRAAEDKTAIEEERKAAQERATFLQDRASGKGHSCHLVSTAQSMVTEMTPIMEDGQNIAAWGLTVRVNGKPVIVEIDTGASGLYLNRGAAEKAGLKTVDHAVAEGISGRQSISLAFADSIKIGDFEFADCIVEVDSHQSVGGHGMGPQGLIGMNVFEDYLVSLDFPLRKLTLSPLPGAKPAVAELDTEGGGSSSTTLTDRYSGPETKGFMEVYRRNHELFIPMLLNGKEELMLIDTGSDGTHFNTALVPDFTKASRDSSYVAYGVGGKNTQISTTGEVKMQMPNGMGQMQNGATASDMRGFFGDMQAAGLLGTSFLYQNVVDIDYRDGLVRFTYDRNHGHNALRGVQ